MPKSFFLDFNTELHTVFAPHNNLLISVTVPGDFLFLHNATSLSFLESTKIPINTYAIAYDRTRNLIGLGGQIANREAGTIEDQVLFYKIVRDCSEVLHSKSWRKK